MDFALPADLVAYLDELDRFIALTIKPLENHDNIRFDHRREWAHRFRAWRLPRPEWGGLPGQNLADGLHPLRDPERYGGKTVPISDGGHFVICRGPACTMICRTKFHRRHRQTMLDRHAATTRRR